MSPLQQFQQDIFICAFPGFGDQRRFGAAKVLDGETVSNCRDGGCWAPKTNLTGEWLQIDLLDTFVLKELTLNFRSQMAANSWEAVGAGSSQGGEWKNIMVSLDAFTAQEKHKWCI